MFFLTQNFTMQQMAQRSRTQVAIGSEKEGINKQ